MYALVNNGNGEVEWLQFWKCECSTESYLLSKLPAFNALKISLSA